MSHQNLRHQASSKVESLVVRLRRVTTFLGVLSIALVGSAIPASAALSWWSAGDITFVNGCHLTWAVETSGAQGRGVAAEYPNCSGSIGVNAKYNEFGTHTTGVYWGGNSKATPYNINTFAAQASH